jgi:hypothetical protein
MASSKEVFALRKEQRLQEAYELGCEVVRENPNDEWNKKALAWCLIDMIKKAIAENNIPLFSKYMTDLHDMNLDLSDDVLKKNIDYLKQISNPQHQIISDAKNFSKLGDHSKAANAFREAIHKFPDDIQLHESLAWEIYRSSKDLFSAENVDIYNAKKILFEYIKLKNSCPSRIHSLYLRYADKLIGKEGFSLVGFLKLWNLENLTEEDFQPYMPENGKSYPSLAEKIIQHAAKEIVEKKMIDDVRFILPYLDDAIKRFTENIWLIYYKAKLLQLANKNDEALDYSISIVKAKMNDFWSWNLLSENYIYSDPDLAFACLCRALLCKSDDKFLGNLRLKVAKTMITKGLYTEAKHEITRIVKARENEGWSLSEELQNFQQQPWYKDAQDTKNNYDLYQQYASSTEELLFKNLPWINCYFGDVFSVESQQKQKRKIYILKENQKYADEVALPESKFSHCRFKKGDLIQIKGEWEHDGRFKFYTVNKEPLSNNFDSFPELIGVITYVNSEKQSANFIVDKHIEGLIHKSDCTDILTVGSKVKLRLSKYQNVHGIRINILSCSATNEEQNSGIIKAFTGVIKISDVMMGFVTDRSVSSESIFVDRDIVQTYNLQDNATISGTAIINFNKKKNQWGWKVLKIDL